MFQDTFYSGSGVCRARICIEMKNIFSSGKQRVRISCVTVQGKILSSRRFSDNQYHHRFFVIFYHSVGQKNFFFIFFEHYEYDKVRY